jgi:hypothetical protein
MTVVSARSFADQVPMHYRTGIATNPIAAQMNQKSRQLTSGAKVERHSTKAAAA